MLRFSAYIQCSAGRMRDFVFIVPNCSAFRLSAMIHSYYLSCVLKEFYDIRQFCFENIKPHILYTCRMLFTISLMHAEFVCLNSINDYIYLGQAHTNVPKCIHITVAVYGGMLFTEGSQ